MHEGLLQFLVFFYQVHALSHVLLDPRTVLASWSWRHCDSRNSELLLRILMGIFFAVIAEFTPWRRHIFFGKFLFWGVPGLNFWKADWIIADFPPIVSCTDKFVRKNIWLVCLTFWVASWRFHWFFLTCKAQSVEALAFFGSNLLFRSVNGVQEGGSFFHFLGTWVLYSLAPRILQFVRNVVC